MNSNCCAKQVDNGEMPYVANVERMAEQNTNFRTAVWTGCYLQMTLMCIPACGEIGLEIHPDTDQFIRVEQGEAVVRMGKCENKLDVHMNICEGCGVFVPAKTWHNIVNIKEKPLKLSTIYAPPKHPKGTVHCTKADAQMEEY